MTGAVLNLPYGIVQLLKIGNSSEITINDYLSYRPDRVLESYGVSSFANEMANNRASNISPISLKVRTSYTILDTLFLSYFRKGE